MNRHFVKLKRASGGGGHRRKLFQGTNTLSLGNTLQPTRAKHHRPKLHKDVCQVETYLGDSL